MRLLGEITYQLEHDAGQVGLWSCWSVPYSAWIYRGQIADIEAAGLATLISLTLHVGPLRRVLDEPGPDERRQWLAVWCHATRNCDAELRELFAQDCLARYWDHPAQHPAHPRKTHYALSRH